MLAHVYALLGSNTPRDLLWAGSFLIRSASNVPAKHTLHMSTSNVEYCVEWAVQKIGCTKVNDG